MAEKAREYKDRLFCFIFGSEEHKDWTLSLYNAVNGTAYANPEDILIETLTQVVYMGMHNDVAFLIADEINMYEQKMDADITVRVRMINVNAGRSPKVIGACKPLDEYTWLVNAIREREKDMTLEAAVDAALDEMPENFLIRPYLEANRVEVKKMLLTEYNETRTMEMFKREGREEGRIEGREEGRVEGRKEGRKEGRGEGEAKLGALITKLRELGRVDDAFRAASDPVYRGKLYAEFGMA